MEREKFRSDFEKEILTDVTVLSRPSLETVAVISTNQIFARVSVHTGFSLALICICEGRTQKNTQSIKRYKPKKKTGRQKSTQKSNI